MAILNGYFPKSPVDLGPIDNALAFNILLRLGDENLNQNYTIATAQSNTSDSSAMPHHPSNANPNATFLMSRTLGLLTSDPTPENKANHNLLSAAIYTHSVKRLVLNKSGH
jgi:hypothetical protein